MKENEFNNTEITEENNHIEITHENDYELLEDDDNEIMLPGFEEVFRYISSLSLPMAISFTFSFQIFLMTVLLNYMSESEDDLAATTLITTMINTLTTIWMSPLFSMSMLASNKVGELNQAEQNGADTESLEKIREYISGLNRNGMMLGTLLSVPVISTLVFSKSILTHILGQNDNVAQITQNFLRTYSPAVLPLMLRMSIEQILFSFGRNTQAMILALTSFILGTGVALGLGFWAKLGPQGLAIGYVFESYLTALLYGLYLAANKDFSQFQFFRMFKLFKGQFQQFLDLIKMGSSFTFSFISEMSNSLSLGIFSGLLGTREQSAVAYVNQYVFLNFLFLASFGATCAQELNRQMGGKKFGHANRIGEYGLLTTLIYTTPIPLIFACSPRLLFIVSKDKDGLEAMLKYLVPIISTGSILDSARYNLLQQLRVLGDARMATLISVLGLSGGIVTGGLLGLKTNLGIYGVGIGYSGGILFTSLPLFYRWLSRIKAKEIKKNAEQQLSVQSIPSVNCFFSFFNRREKKIDNVKIEDIENGELLSNNKTTKYDSI